MDVIEQLDDLIAAFQAPEFQDPKLQIFYAVEDPCPLAERYGGNALSLITTGVSVELEEVYKYARKAAHFASPNLKQLAPDAESRGLQTLRLLETSTTTIEQVYQCACQAAHFAPQVLKSEDASYDPLSAESWGWQTIRLIEHPSTIDHIYALAKTAASFGEIVQTKEREVGPVFEVDRATPL